MRVWWTMYQFQERSLAFAWYDPVTGLLYDFSTGFTFSLKLVSLDKYYHNKTAGITGYATSPNVVAAITASELGAVPPGIYKAILTATRTVDSVDFVFEEDDPPIIEILKTPVAS